MTDGDANLRSISARVKEHMQTLRCTTIVDVANAIVAEYQSNGSVIAEDTLRRRVYDVITVCTAIKYIKKADKALLWAGDDAFQKDRSLDEQKMRRARMDSKEESIRHKARLLLFYRALMVANRSASRPITAIAFPLIVIGRKGPNWSVRQDQDNHRLTIEAATKPKIISPFDILSMRTFPQDVIDAAIQGSRELAAFRGLLNATDRPS
jgi:hypothetical protein